MDLKVNHFENRLAEKNHKSFSWHHRSYPYKGEHYYFHMGIAQHFNFKDSLTSCLVFTQLRVT